ncbi:hypothetical protein B0H14DRAFT_3873938 [Mycena olivaceomarginata]|nr:hypothetical protein B0H14DRAFT_3873938 [Mycena olivaceomarginata]
MTSLDLVQSNLDVSTTTLRKICEVSYDFFASPLLVFSHHLIALFPSSSRLCAPSHLWTPAFSPPSLCSRKRVQKCLVNVSHFIQTTSAYTIDAACIPRLGPLRMTNIIALRIQDKTGTELDNIPVLRWMALVGHVVEQARRGGVGDVVYGR